jgi:predicted O-methyltransferase YrrM
MNDTARDPMFDLAQPPIDVVVEIGTLVGHWARRCLIQLPEATVYCVDPWSKFVEPERWRGQWKKNTKEFGSRCVELRGTSDEWAPKFDKTIDLLFIDGNHTIFQVTADLENWVPKVRAGGLVVGHDIRIPKVRYALTQWANKHRVKWQEDLLYWTPKAKDRDKRCFWFYKE